MWFTLICPQIEAGGFFLMETQLDKLRYLFLFILFIFVFLYIFCIFIYFYFIRLLVSFSYTSFVL